ncbi:MAG: carbohydrate kinase family protein [Nitrososphaerota archaeon]|nr:carbohydrate kinase family protein [Nitrososphaerota archaeon]
MPPKFDVAVMHDYFVDRLVHVKGIDGLMGEVTRKAAEGGGGIHGVVQEEVRGGNAVNLAHALCRLGLRTLLITHCEKVHEHLLRKSFQGLKAVVKVKPLPAGLTVAIEEDVNVMLGDGRGASDFGPSLLDESDWRGLAGSRVVCSVNWAANRRGTELLSALRRRLGTEKTIFVDLADFRDQPERFAALLASMRRRRLADWVSMNEYEARAAAAASGIYEPDRAEACMRLARKLGVVLDVHCVDSSFTSEGTRVTARRTKVIRTKRLTGAGDVWDAASIFGRLDGMEEGKRLEFANRAARLYLESPDPVPPTLAQVKGP